MVKKLKELRVNSTPGSKFGTDPLNPWSTKSDITEASEQELLHRYLKSRGINPQFVSKQTKIAHSKSSAYLSWRKNHEFDESVTTQPSPFEIKRKELRKSVQAHKVLPSDVSSDGMHTEAKTIQGTALDKFRQAAAEREKKHYELQQKQSKDGSGMSAAIDRLEKHLNKEEVELEEAKHYPYRFRATYHDPDTDKMTHVMDFNHKSLEAAKKHAEGSRLQRRDGKEDKLHSVVQMKEETEQIDEISKSTLASYKDKSTASLKNAQANRDAAEHGKHMSKGFADLHKKSDEIAKKRVKGLKGYLQRKVGMKPVSENILDSQAATEAPVGPGEISADQPSMYRKKELSKSARMIKALYKKKGMSEEMYDWEKDDKAQSYGKKPKISKPEEDGKKSDGDDARIVVSGGKTLTGEPRDTIEVDPFMKKPKTNAPDDFEKPTSKKDH
jgi:hypothetical protein